MDYDFDYYAGSGLSTPEKPSKPSLSRNVSASEARDYADALEYYEKEMMEYKSDYARYSEQKRNRLLELQTKLRDEYDITEAQMFVLFNKAYDEGHSSGLRLVVSLFGEYYDMASEFAALEKDN